MAGKRGDGLKFLGTRHGKKHWEARLYWIDERTGEERERRKVIQADSKPLAHQKRAAALDAAKSGSAVPRSERKRFREIANDWLARAPRAHATKIADRTWIKQINEHFGDWWLEAVTVRAMQEYLDALTTGVRAKRAVLVAVWRWAVKGHHASENLAKLTEAPRSEAGDRAEAEDAPNRALSAEQVARLLDWLEENQPNAYAMAFVQYATGCRFAELTALRRSDLNLETGLIDIRRGQVWGVTGPTKKRYARVAALPLEARAVLRAHLDRMAVEQWPGWEELVFPRPVTGRRRTSNYWAITSLGNILRAAFTAIGVEVKGTTHVARHTMISIADELGVSDTVLREVVGHRSKRAHQGYKHPRQAKIIQLGDAIGRKIREGSTGRKTGTSGHVDNADPGKRGTT